MRKYMSSDVTPSNDGGSNRTLPDDFLLLALRSDRRIGFGEQTLIRYGLAAAQVIELALKGRVRVIGNRVAIVDQAATGDSQLDKALSIVAKVGSGRTTDVLRKLGDQIQSYGKRLTATGLATGEGSKGFMNFRGPEFLLAPGTTAQDELKRRVEEAQRTGGSDDPYLALGALAHATKLSGSETWTSLRAPYGEVATAVTAAVQAVQSAIVAACVLCIMVPGIGLGASLWNRTHAMWVLIVLVALIGGGFLLGLLSDMERR